MKPEEKNVEEILKQHWSSASQEEAEADCNRVLHRLRTTAEREPNTRREASGFLSFFGTRMGMISAAAAVLLAVVLGTTMVQRYRAVAVVEKSGATVAVGEVVRADGDGSTLVLTDGSRVEMRAQSELVLERANDGLRIRLNNGDVIVNAARQHGHLYVQTRDLKVSVVGTVFLVKADDNGSRVAVIEGEVRVQQGTVEKSLQPGEQLASNPKSDDWKFFLETGWSREAHGYLSKLHESMAQSLAARQSPGRTASVSDKPKFEEASIRLCEREIPGAALQGGRGGPVGGSGSIRITPGRVDALCMTVATLIRTAHRPLNNNPLPFLERPIEFGMNSTNGLEPEDGTRVRGGPDWVRSEKYTIAAVGDSKDAPTLRGPMLMDLLERRFNLKLRVETEEAPVYALTIAKGGLKIKPFEIDSAQYEELRRIRPSLGTYTDAAYLRADPKDLATYSGLLGCSFLSRAVRFDPVELSRFREEVRRGLQPRECVEPGREPEDANSPNWVINPHALPISRLVWVLKTWTPLILPDTLNGLMVVDKTGLPETNCLDAIPPAGTPCAPLFNFVLEFALDESYLTRGGRTPNRPKAPNIFDAFEKLGLHLEKVKDPREFIVIEQIERPSPN